MSAPTAMYGKDAPAAKPAAETANQLEVLNEYINLKQIGVLNAVDDAAALEVVKGGGFLRSSTDEQLLLHIPFTEAIKLKAIRLRADDCKGVTDCSAVKTLKVFVNNPNMDFGDTDSVEPGDVLQFSLGEAKMGGQKDVKFVKFQNVRSLTLFVQANQGDDESSFLNNIVFMGTVVAGTNMKDLKKVG